MTANNADVRMKKKGRPLVFCAGAAAFQGGESQRVFRGGGWLGNGAACRSACRAAERGDYAFGFVGFRLAMDE